MTDVHKAQIDKHEALAHHYRALADNHSAQARYWGQIAPGDGENTVVVPAALWDALIKAAQELIMQGSLIRGNGPVAYVFVAPVDARDDLASVLHDIDMHAEEES